MEKIKFLSSILSSSLGNILEWYDFGMFAIFSTVFSQLFFPTSNPKVALIATFSIFAVGFICRPIGALIFGYLGDKIGRAKTLRLSILMIALPTLLISLIPSYAQIGILAPILLTVTRILQGISIGGEYSGNIIYLAEIAPSRYRATITSFAGTGANIGILLASLVGILLTTFLSHQQLSSIGWRLAYLLSGVFCLIIYRFRLRIHETLVFEYLKNKHQLAINPIKTAIKKNYLQIIRTLGMVCMGSTFYYFSFIYLPFSLSQHHPYPMYYISMLMSLLLGVMIFLVPLCGLICDKIGRRKMMLFNALFIMCAVIPGCYFLQSPHFYIVALVITLFAIASSLEQGTTSITVVENFPSQARYTGLSLGYNLGNGLLGGTVPMICEWLIAYTSSTLAPAFYIAFCALITGLVVYFFVPETYQTNLRA